MLLQLVTVVQSVDSLIIGVDTARFGCVRAYVLLLLTAGALEATSKDGTSSLKKALKNCRFILHELYNIIRHLPNGGRLTRHIPLNVKIREVVNVSLA